MELNSDAVRDVLLVLEDSFEYVAEESFEHNGYYTQGELLFEVMSKTKQNQTDIKYAIESLIHTTLLDFVEPPAFYSGNIKIAKIRGLSWSGHEFLDNIRNDTIWEATKKRAKSMTKVSVSALVSGAKFLTTLWMTDPDRFYEVANQTFAMLP